MKTPGDQRTRNLSFYRSGGREAEQAGNSGCTGNRERETAAQLEVTAVLLALWIKIATDWGIVLNFSQACLLSFFSFVV